MTTTIRALSDAVQAIIARQHVVHDQKDDMPGTHAANPSCKRREPNPTGELERAMAAHAGSATATAAIQSPSTSTANGCGTRRPKAAAAAAVKASIAKPVTPRSLRPESFRTAWISYPLASSQSTNAGFVFPVGDCWKNCRG
jgi:hypothetical protein